MAQLLRAACDQLAANVEEAEWKMKKDSSKVRSRNTSKTIQMIIMYIDKSLNISYDTHFLLESLDMHMNTYQISADILKKFLTSGGELSLNNKVNSIAMKAHKLLKCRGISRSDFRFYNNKFYLLEINTQPGMTKLSLVPEIAAFKGISFIKLIEWILKDASTKK